MASTAQQSQARESLTWRPKACAAVCIALLAGVLAGCSSSDADLTRFIQQTKASPGGRVEPLPEVQPYEAFTYTDQNLRSPFVPSISGNAVRPDSRRAREYLEQFSLDTLKMVGTLDLGGKDYGLVMAGDGRVHRVLIGEHIGQNDGTITQITPSKIALTEIVPDGLGGYVQRPAALALNQ
ncbi:MAG TPA: pilus assembly protein PilP [Steroidobacteraceae bacterium]|jgi:type IV pilus assembly protein PilP|nr:pilus assembly protein PilP [Steroidobacteraceae bacterium]